MRRGKANHQRTKRRARCTVRHAGPKQVPDRASLHQAASFEVVERNQRRRDGESGWWVYACIKKGGGTSQQRATWTWGVAVQGGGGFRELGWLFCVERSRREGGLAGSSGLTEKREGGEGGSLLVGVFVREQRGTTN